MKLRTRISSMAIAIAFALCPMTSNADWVGDFYNASGAGINVTPPQAITSQSMVGFAGGGVSWRVPTKTFQPLSVTPPSIKSGCNGIDIYLGSYSFPNKAAFVAALRNFGQASLGYFFNLALKTMAPEIEGALTAINDLATRINGANIGGCKDAKKFVDSMADMLYDSTASSTAGGYSGGGTSPDYNEGQEKIKSQSYWDTVRDRYAQISGKTPATLTPADAGKFDLPHSNVLFWSLKHNKALDLTDDEIELIMSLIGPSLIIGATTDKDGDDALSTDKGLAASLDFKALVGLNLGVSAEHIKVIRCDDYTQCLAPTISDELFVSFSKRTESVVKKVMTAVSTRSTLALTADEQIVMKLSSVPLYRAAALAATGGAVGGMAAATLGDLQDYAAMDAARTFVTYYLDIAAKGLAKMSTTKDTYKPDIKKMEDRIEALRLAMTSETTAFYQKRGNPYEKLAELEKVERFMFSNINSMLASNARFNKH